MQEEITNQEAELESKEEGETLEENKEESLPQSKESGDPLDSFSESELRMFIIQRGGIPSGELSGLIHEAKKLRSIEHRKEKKEVEVKTEAFNPYMTKKDFEMANEKEAISLAKESNAEVKENFSEISKLYVNRNGRARAKDILEDLNDAYLLWKSKNGKKEEKPEKELTSTTVTNPSGSSPKESKQKGLKVLKSDTGDLADKWYGK